MTKKMKLKFNMEDWIKILSKINFTETDPNQEFSPAYKKEVIARNEEKKILSQFLSDLKEKKTVNKKIIDNSYGGNHPFPEAIEIPETKNGLMARIITNIIEKIESKDFYYNLLKNNNQPNYQELVWRMSSERRRDNVVLRTDFSTNEDSLLVIFQQAIALCPPKDVQDAFEHFASEYEKINGIDSKSETEEKRNEMLSTFHKAMRQTDMFGNGHACSIIYNLWHVTDIPIRAMIAVTEHVNELNTEKI